MPCSTGSAGSSRPASSCSRPARASTRPSTPSSRARRSCTRSRFPEGLTSEQIVARLNENEVLTGDVTEIPREGTLLPDTYKFERGMTRQQIVNAHAGGAARRRWTRSGSAARPTCRSRRRRSSSSSPRSSRRRPAAPTSAPGSPASSSTASTKRMKLQSDPTIVYGLVGGKGTLGRGILRSRDREADALQHLRRSRACRRGRSPIPAAPRSRRSPTRRAPRTSISSPTARGGHAFAETLRAAQRNVARWRQIEKAPRDAGRAAPVDRVEPPIAADGVRPARPCDERLGRSRPTPARPRADAARPGAAAPGPAADARGRSTRARARRATRCSTGPSTSTRRRPSRRCGRRRHARRVAGLVTGGRRPRHYGPRRSRAAARFASMAIASMTGFAREAGATGPFQWAWEIKTVNGRGLEVRRAHAARASTPSARRPAARS